MKLAHKTALVFVALFFFLITETFACMTIIVGKDISPTGYVLVGHNEDDEGRIHVGHGYVEPASWPEGTVLPSESRRASIPQVSETFGFYWSQAKTVDGGLSWADTFFNDNGVLIVSNNCGPSREATSNASRITDGGIEYNLRRIVAERATSARHGVELVIELLERYGYFPSGRAYTIADNNEAWMIQIVSGKHYVAVKVPDNHVAVMPNHYTIHGLDEYDDIIYSPDLVSYARSQGWYNPIRDGAFDFAKVYQADSMYQSAHNTYRQAHALSLLLGTPWTDSYYPFSVELNRTVGIEKIQQILSYHYEGTYDDPDYERTVVPGGAPHDTTIRRICTATTIESTICEFAATPKLTTLWTAFGRPCELPYIPLHPLNGLPQEIDTMADPAAELASHFASNPDLNVCEDSGWQEFRNIQNVLDMVYEDSYYTLNRLVTNWNFLMKQENDKVLSDVTWLSEEDATKTLNAFDQKQMTNTLSIMHEYVQSSNVVPATGMGNLVLFDPGTEYKVVFTLEEGIIPIEATIRFGLGGYNTRTAYDKALEGSLIYLGEGKWQVSFDPIALAMRSFSPGNFEHFLGGRTSAGTSFGSMVVIPFVFF